jgi:hypothetical protein
MTDNNVLSVSLGKSTGTFLEGSFNTPINPMRTAEAAEAEDPVAR